MEEALTIWVIVIYLSIAIVIHTVITIFCDSWVDVFIVVIAVVCSDITIVIHVIA